MKETDRQALRAGRIAVLVIAAAYACRLLSRLGYLPLTLDYIRSVLYLILFVAWGVSVRARILQAQVRRYLTAITVLMVFWLCVRSAKYFIFTDPFIRRCLWYLFYLPMLFIPLLGLLVALSLGKPEGFRLPGRMRLLYLPAAALLLLVLTNDLHQFVFTFSQLPWDDSSNGYAVGYWFVLSWTFACSIGALSVMLFKCRVPNSRARLLLPFFPGAAGVVYGIIYVSGVHWLRVIAGDMTVVVCLAVMAALEGCIQVGLLSSNTHYDSLFRISSIQARITDADYNVLLASAGAEPLSEALMRRTEAGPVLLDGGLRLSGAPVRGGHVLWSEDVSELTGVLAELADNGEYLTTREHMLQREVETCREEQRLAEKNRLYNRLMNETKSELARYAELVEQLEKTQDKAQEKQLVAKLTVVCTYIKRRGNLLFLAEKYDWIDDSELRYALEEWLSNLRLCGVKCGSIFCMEQPVSFDAVIGLYDGLQAVLLFAADSLQSLFLNACFCRGRPCLLLNLSCGKDLSGFSHSGVTVSDEGGGEWVLTVLPAEGGGAE